jgi:uncharacterized protein YnzC (UPF0291/DUF896 family)
VWVYTHGETQMLLSSFDPASMADLGGEVATPPRHRRQLEPLAEKPKKLTTEEKDLRFWLREQALDTHFDAFRQHGIRSVEQVKIVPPCRTIDRGWEVHMGQSRIMSACMMEGQRRCADGSQMRMWRIVVGRGLER